MTVQNIFDFLNQKFPTCTACDFDNVGILVGDKDAVVKRALIALDCTSITVDEAVENGCNFLPLLSNHNRFQLLHSDKQF